MFSIDDPEGPGECECGYKTTNATLTLAEHPTIFLLVPGISPDTSKYCLGSAGFPCLNPYLKIRAEGDLSCASNICDKPRKICVDVKNTEPVTKSHASINCSGTGTILLLGSVILLKL